MRRIEYIGVALSIVAIVLAAAIPTYVYMALSGITEDIEQIKGDIGDLMEFAGPEIEKLHGAREEGKVVYYTSWPSEYNAALETAFEEKYPWIDAEWWRSSSYKVLEKYLAEKEAGKVECDLFSIADVSVFLDFTEEGGYFLYYDAPFYDYYPAAVQDRGWWCAWRDYSYAIIYNKELCPVEIKSWWDLTKPELKGKLGMEDPRIGGTYTQYYALRKALGTEFWEKMGQQDVLIMSGSGPGCEAVAAGEIYAFINVCDYQTPGWVAQTEGLVAGVWPPEGVCGSPVPMAITADAEHPNAAKIFMDWLLSPDGQRVVVENGASSPRIGLGLAPEGIPTDLTHITPTDWADVFEKREAYLEEFEGFFGL